LQFPISLREHIEAHGNHTDLTRRGKPISPLRPIPGRAPLRRVAEARTIEAMKATPKKKARARGTSHKRAASLGRSPVTGAPVLKPVAKGASISLDDVRRVVRTLKPLALD